MDKYNIDGWTGSCGSVNYISVKHGSARQERCRGTARGHCSLIEAEGLTLAAEHVEVETGNKGADTPEGRPVLREPLPQRKSKAAVVVAKLQLGRSSSLLLGQGGVNVQRPSEDPR